MVAAQAEELTTSTQLHLRCAHDPVAGAVVLDLGQPGTARCVVVTRTGWQVQDAPPTGCYFRRPGSLLALPDPTPGGSLEPLRELLGFAPEDDRWHLARGWLTVAPLATIPRPLMVPLGAAGSGKTTRARCLVSVLDPREELGSSFGRNADDDRVTAYSRFLVGYDNLSSVSETVSDHIARLVTGETAEKRRNYSDTDTVSITYRRSGVITAITLPTLRPDALERIVPLHLDRMTPQARTSETRLRHRFADAHPGILGAVLDGLVRVLDGLPALLAADPQTVRMKDYSLALLALDPSAFDAYQRSAAGVLTAAAEDDPLVAVVREYVAARQAATQAAEVVIEPKIAYADMTPIALRAGSAWWPRDPAALSRALVRASGPLAAVGIEFEPDASGTRKTTGRRWTFRPGASQQASGGPRW